MVIFCIVLLVIWLVFKAKDRARIRTVTELYRGTQSERQLVLKLLKYGISSKAIFHDLYFYKGNGEYSQVDLVVAAKVGIIVFEVKDYSGWIFGNGLQDQWTKVLAYGSEKYRFYNPVKQNAGHISCIKKQLSQFCNIPFYSVVVFYGDCRLKRVNDIPDNVYLVYPSQISNVLNHILSHNPPAPYTDKWEIVRLFENAANNGADDMLVRKHADTVRQRYAYRNERTNVYMNNVFRRLGRRCFKIKW